MKVGDEVYAVIKNDAWVRHGHITNIDMEYHSGREELVKTFTVEYDDFPSYKLIINYDFFYEDSLFTDKAQAVAYAHYLRRNV